MDEQVSIQNDLSSQKAATFDKSQVPNEVLAPQAAHNRFWLPSQLHTWVADFKSSSGHPIARARSAPTVGNDNPEQSLAHDADVLLKKR